MPRSDAAAPTSPEDYVESDNLSNWGSEHGTPTHDSATVGGSGGNNQPRSRRLSAPFMIQGHVGGSGVSSSRTNRTGRARDGRGAAGGDVHEGGNSNRLTKRDINGSGGGGDPTRPAWNVSTKATAGTKSRRLQEQVDHAGALGSGVCGGVGAAGTVAREYAADDPGRGKSGGGSSSGRQMRQMPNRRKVKRNSIGGVSSVGSSGDGGGRASGVGGGGVGTGGGGRVGGVDNGGGDAGGGSRENTVVQEEDGLAGAAPTQEDIRVMIERIRLQTNDAAPSATTSGQTAEQQVVGPTASRRGVQARALFSSTPATQQGINSSGSAHRRAASCSVATVTAETAGAGVGGSGGDRPATATSAVDTGGVGMVEIEEEEQRLRERASKLQSEMSALKRRRLEVRLVKVEQQLKDEAAVRLIQREEKVQAAVERACIALRKEREERVKAVTKVKEDLKDKLDQLSTMYEEVSARVETLDEAYVNAEDELRERATADQQKAIEREDRGLRRRMKALVTEHGTDVSKERFAREEAQAQEAQHQQQQAQDGKAAATTDTTTATPTAAPVARGRGRALALKGSAGGGAGGDGGGDGGAERSPERSGNVEKGVDQRRRSVGGATSKSVGAIRRRRRVSVGK